MSTVVTCRDNVRVQVRQHPLTRSTAADLARTLLGWPRNAIDDALSELEHEGIVAREIESTNGGAPPTKTYWYVIAP